MSRTKIFLYTVGGVFVAWFLYNYVKKANKEKDEIKSNLGITTGYVTESRKLGVPSKYYLYYNFRVNSKSYSGKSFISKNTPKCFFQKNECKGNCFWVAYDTSNPSKNMLSTKYQIDCDTVFDSDLEDLDFSSFMR